jgi:hypothetical protein
MKGHIREVKKEVQQLMDSGEIEDYEFDHDRRHNLVRFKAKGSWHSVVFAASPRTPYANNFTRQQIRRRIRSLP